MSRSNPTLSNPCTKFIEVSSDDGSLFYYDKEAKEKIDVPLPCYFAVLDELSTISGFNKKHKCGIYSNEIHSTMKEVLRVKTFKGGESITGLYADIKEKIVALGGKFSKSVYALFITGEDMNTEFVNFKFKGSSFSAWLDKGFNPMNFIVGITEFVEEQNGNNTYQVPVFKPFKSNPQIDAAAIEQDKILQEYLKAYKSQQPEQEVAQEAAQAEKQSQQTEGFQASGEWKGGSKSTKTNLPPTIDELKEQTKQIMERGKGKQPVQSMSKVEELGELPPEEFNNANDVDDLPFIFTIPIALGLLMQFIV